MVKFQDIDLSSLKDKSGKIIEGMNVELAVIRYFKLNTTAEHNTIELVNDYIANKLAMTANDKYSYTDLVQMVREKYYNTTIFRFKGLVEHLVLKQVDPNVIDIIYDSVVDIETLTVRFKLVY